MSNGSAQTGTLKFQKVLDKNPFLAFGSNPYKWRKVSFDVHNTDSIGWFDIFLGETGNWSYVEHHPKDPKMVMLFNSPMLMDRYQNMSDERIADQIANYVTECHKITKTDPKWEQISIPLESRPEIKSSAPFEKAYLLD